MSQAPAPTRSPQLSCPQILWAKQWVTAAQPHACPGAAGFSLVCTIRQHRCSKQQREGQFLALNLASREHEVFARLFRTAHNQLISYDELFRGTISATSVHPREVVKRVLAVNAAAVIFALSSSPVNRRTRFDSWTSRCRSPGDRHRRQQREPRGTRATVAFDPSFPRRMAGIFVACPVSVCVSGQSRGDQDRRLYARRLRPCSRCSGHSRPCTTRNQMRSRVRSW
jgi:hypothetical protein